jgi:hypothetical protein
VTKEGFEGTEAGQSMDFWIPLQNRAEFNVLGQYCPAISRIA